MKKNENKMGEVFFTASCTLRASPILAIMGPIRSLVLAMSASSSGSYWPSSRRWWKRFLEWTLPGWLMVAGLHVVELEDWVELVELV